MNATSSPKRLRLRARSPLALLILSFALCSSSCDISWTETVYGTGVAGVESRSVRAFDSIVVSGGLEVDIEVGAGPTLFLRGDANLLEYVTLVQTGQGLRIGVREGFALKPAPQVSLLAPALTSAKVVGSSDLRAVGVAGGDLRLVVVGSGEICISGVVSQLTTEIVGSGSLQLAELAADRAQIKIVGSGEIDTKVHDSIHASITGSGRVRYLGSPSIESRFVGAGVIERMRD